VENNRNMLLALVIAGLILFGWGPLMTAIFPDMAPKPTVKTAAKTEASKATAAAGKQPGIAKDAVQPLKTALASSGRVKIDTPKLSGSINLAGARIDDIILKKYKETIKKDSGNVRLLAPGGTKNSFYAQVGWGGTGFTAPASDAVWTLASGSILTPTTPIALTFDNGQGQAFRMDISVDKDYLFTIKQSVTNTGTAAITINPYALANRIGHPADPDTWTVHIGPMAVIDDPAENDKGSYVANYDIGYAELDEGQSLNSASNGGWVGFTDKYWLTALIPDQSAKVTLQSRAGEKTAGQPRLYQTNVAYAETQLAPGTSLTTSTRIFAGAKEAALLDSYMETAGVPRFDHAIDWGWFKWFEKPMFALLDWLFRNIGNFGVAIMALTLIVRGVMFPIAQRQFRSMAQMRVVQPKMKAIQDKYKDDKPKMQQEIMQLYKTEKINPLAGCLPIFLQIPIFYALYKVLILTIEMRHQPFFLWIKDLSAPDPATFLNLFGYLDFQVPALLGIGVLALLLGISMWLQFKLNPQPMDEIQAQVFGIMPWVLMFVMAPFAAGLLIYWITSNFLTIAQQKWLYNQYPALKTPPATPAKA
jgi:YidC/Oxa1 family membrane protein insertase